MHSCFGGVLGSSRRDQRNSLSQAGLCAQEAADNSDSTIRDAAARKAASEQQRRDSKARAAAGADRARTDAAARAEAAARQAEEEAKRAEQDVEDMLADLKRKMNN